MHYPWLHTRQQSSKKRKLHPQQSNLRVSSTTPAIEPARNGLGCTSQHRKSGKTAYMFYISVCVCVRFCCYHSSTALHYGKSSCNTVGVTVRQPAYDCGGLFYTRAGQLKLKL